MHSRGAWYLSPGVGKKGVEEGRERKGERKGEGREGGRERGRVWWVIRELRKRVEGKEKRVEGVEEGGRGWKRVEEGGRGWKRVEEGGRGWKRVEGVARGRGKDRERNTLANFNSAISFSNLEASFEAACLATLKASSAATLLSWWSLTSASLTSSISWEGG